jgi:Holliday junction resolvase
LSNYIAGRNAEYAIKRLLISRGYLHVLRSAGSHTPIDLIAADGRKRLAIQVKRGRYVSRREKLLLIEWAKAFRASPVLATKVDGRWSLHLLQNETSLKGLEL